MKDIEEADLKDKHERRKMSPKKKEIMKSSHTSSQTKLHNKNLKQLMDRDKKLALKQRQRLDSARNKNNRTNIFRGSAVMTNFENKPQTNKNAHIRSHTITRSQNTAKKPKIRLNKREDYHKASKE